MPISAWYYDTVDTSDQRAPHKTDRVVSTEELDKLGVLSFQGITGD
jgi:hypothetical protein